MNEGLYTLPELKDGDALTLHVMDDILIKATIAPRYEIRVDEGVELLLGVERIRFTPTPEQVLSLNSLRWLVRV